MRAISAGIPWTTLYNPFDGDAGRALYVSPAGVTDAREIVYRRLRLLSAGPASVCIDFPLAGDGPLGLDAHVALVKTPDPLEWTLPEEYLDESFVVNVRPHLGGLELDTISGTQLITVDAEAEPVATIDGCGEIVQATKRDGGGVIVWAIYTPSSTGAQPVTLKLTTAEDSDLVATLDYLPPGRDFRFELSGLVNAITYTLQLIAVDADGAGTILSTQHFTADAAGPPSVSVSFEVD